MDLNRLAWKVFVIAALAMPAMAAEKLQPRAEIGVKAGNKRGLLMTEFWVPLAQENNGVLYGDIRLMGDDDRNREGNLGLGYRQIIHDAVLGGHVWIDRRKTENNSTFHQMTFGVERLGHVVDARMNGYVPLNGTSLVKTANAGSPIPYIIGSGIFFDTNGLLREVPQYGVDAELGYRMPVLKRQFDTIRFYGGGYHFFRDGTDNVTGMRVRTEAQVNKAIGIGVRLQYDALRGSQGFLEATLKFPFTAKKLYQDVYIRARLDESPERDVDIVTASKQLDSGLRKPVINAQSQQAQRILFVDNTASVSGNGSKENPFNTLSLAQAAMQDNDIIYINRGDGTSASMDQGLVINKKGVSVIGSGSNFVWDSDRFSGQSSTLPVNGTLILSAGAAPVITNNQAFVDDGNGILTSNTGNGIFITADDAFVSGVHVDGASASGIYVLSDQNSPVLKNVTLSNNTVTNSLSGRGISVIARNGGVIENVIASNITASGNSGTRGRGVEFYSLGVGSHIANATLLNSTLNGNSSVGLGVEAVTGGSIGVVTVDNTYVHNNAQRNIYVRSDNATFGDIYLMNTIVENIAGVGVYVSAVNNGTFNSVNADNVKVNGSTSHGFSVEAKTAGKINNINLQNLEVYDSGTTGVRIDVGDVNSRINNAIYRNIKSYDNQYGMYLTSSSSAAMNGVTISDVVVHDNDLDGIYLNASSGIALIDNVAINRINTYRNGRDGISLVAAAGTASKIQNAVLSDIDTTDNVNNGVKLGTTAGRLEKISIDNIRSSGNVRGISFESTLATGNMSQIEVKNSYFLNNTNGVNISATGTIQDIKLLSVVANNNTNSGFNISKSVASGIINNVLIADSDMIGNGSYGVLLSKTAAGTFNVDLGGGSMNSVGQNRIYNNIVNDMSITGYTAEARNNWWGISTGLDPSRATLASGGAVNAAPYLATNPR